MLTRGCWSVEWFPVEIWSEFIPKIGGGVSPGWGEAGPKIDSLGSDE